MNKLALEILYCYFDDENILQEEWNKVRGNLDKKDADGILNQHREAFPNQRMRLVIDRPTCCFPGLMSKQKDIPNTIHLVK